jgi:PAS domain-containing protein
MREGLIVLNINRKPVLMNPRAELLLGLSYREDLTLEALGLNHEVTGAVDELFADDARLAVRLEQMKRVPCEGSGSVTPA